MYPFIHTVPPYCTTVLLYSIIIPRSQDLSAWKHASKQARLLGAAGHGPGFRESRTGGDDDDGGGGYAYGYDGMAGS